MILKTVLITLKFIFIMCASLGAMSYLTDNYQNNLNKAMFALLLYNMIDFIQFLDLN